MLKELKEVIKNPQQLQENYYLFSEFIGLDGNWIEPEHKWGGRRPKMALLWTTPNPQPSFATGVS